MSSAEIFTQHTKRWMFIAPNEVLFLTQEYRYFLLFLHKNIYCGYSLEAPPWGISNEEYLQQIHSTS